MRKMLCLMLALLCAVSLLAGCRSSEGQPQSSETETSAPQTEDGNTGSSETTEMTEASETTQTTEASETTMVGLPGEAQSGGDITLGQTGKLKITYTVDRNSVRYITSASQLPDYEELKGYDDAYFQDHALILVMETVTSGSVNVDIESVAVDGGIAAVTLSHEMPEGMTTAVMTTWLLWAEVETGLDYEWVLTNPAVPSEQELY